MTHRQTPSEFRLPTQSTILPVWSPGNWGSMNATEPPTTPRSGSAPGPSTRQEILGSRADARPSPSPGHVAGAAGPPLRRIRPAVPGPRPRHRRAAEHATAGGLNPHTDRPPPPQTVGAMRGAQGSGEPYAQSPQRRIVRCAGLFNTVDSGHLIPVVVSSAVPGLSVARVLGGLAESRPSSPSAIEKRSFACDGLITMRLPPEGREHPPVAPSVSAVS